MRDSYKWQEKAVGTANQGFLWDPTYNFIRDNVMKDLREYNSSTLIDGYNDPVMGVKYHKNWKITWPFRALGKKLVGWGIKKGVKEMDKALKGYKSYYKGEYIVSWLKSPIEGIRFNTELLSELYDKTGYAPSYDSFVAEIEAELVKQPPAPSTVFSSVDWRTKVMPDILKEMFARKMDEMAASLYDRFDDSNFDKSVFEKTLKEGIERLGHVFQAFSDRLAGHTNILDVPMRLFETPVTDIPDDFTEEQKEKLKNTVHQGFSTPEKVRGLVNAYTKLYEKNHPESKVFPRDRVELKDRIGIKDEYDKNNNEPGVIAGVSYYVTPVMKGAVNLAAKAIKNIPNLPQAAVQAGNIAVGAAGIMYDLGKVNLDYEADQIAMDMQGVQNWQKKVLGKYDRSIFLNKATNDYVIGRVKTTLQEWKFRHEEKPEDNTMVFGKEYGSRAKHWRVLAPLKAFGRKLKSWAITLLGKAGIYVGAAAGAAIAKKALAGGFDSYVRGEKVYDTLNYINNENLEINDRLATKLYNYTGYSITNESIRKRLFEALNAQKGVAFWHDKWRKEVVPGMIRSMYLAERERMFKELAERFENGDEKVKNPEIFRKWLEGANSVLGEIFADFSEKVANNTDFLNIPPRLYKDAAMDKEQINNVPAEYREVLKKKGIRPGLTTVEEVENAIDKEVTEITPKFGNYKERNVYVLQDQEMPQLLRIEKEYTMYEIPPREAYKRESVGAIGKYVPGMIGQQAASTGKWLMDVTGVTKLYEGAKDLLDWMKGKKRYEDIFANMEQKHIDPISMEDEAGRIYLQEAINDYRRRQNKQLIVSSYLQLDKSTGEKIDMQVNDENAALADCREKLANTKTELLNLLSREGKYYQDENEFRICLSRFMLLKKLENRAVTENLSEEELQTLLTDANLNREAAAMAGTPWFNDLTVGDIESIALDELNLDGRHPKRERQFAFEIAEKLNGKIDKLNDELLLRAFENGKQNYSTGLMRIELARMMVLHELQRVCGNFEFDLRRENDNGSFAENGLPIEIADDEEMINKATYELVKSPEFLQMDEIRMMKLLGDKEACRRFYERTYGDKSYENIEKTIKLRFYVEKKYLKIEEKKIEEEQERIKAGLEDINGKIQFFSEELLKLEDGGNEIYQLEGSEKVNLAAQMLYYRYLKRQFINGSVSREMLVRLSKEPELSRGIKDMIDITRLKEAMNDEFEVQEVLEVADKYYDNQIFDFEFMSDELMLRKTDAFKKLDVMLKNINFKIKELNENNTDKKLDFDICQQVYRALAIHDLKRMCSENYDNLSLIEKLTEDDLAIGQHNMENANVEFIGENEEGLVGGLFGGLLGNQQNKEVQILIAAGVNDKTNELYKKQQDAISKALSGQDILKALKNKPEIIKPEKEEEDTYEDAVGEYPDDESGDIKEENKEEIIEEKKNEEPVFKNIRDALKDMENSMLSEDMDNNDELINSKIEMLSGKLAEACQEKQNNGGTLTDEKAKSAFAMLLVLYDIKDQSMKGSIKNIAPMLKYSIVESASKDKLNSDALQKLSVKDIADLCTDPAKIAVFRDISAKGEKLEQKIAKEDDKLQPNEQEKDKEKLNRRQKDVVIFEGEEYFGTEPDGEDDKENDKKNEAELFESIIDI